MLQFYRKPMLHGLLIELFLQISCSANSKTNSIINKPQFDVVGHAHNQTEVIKRSIKLNLNDEIKLQLGSNTSTHSGCNFNETLLDVGKLVHFSNVDADQEKAGSSKLQYESDEPLPPEEYMFRNGKKILVNKELQSIHSDFYSRFMGYDGKDEDNDEEVAVHPAYEDLVTWVNKKYIYNYLFPRASTHRTVSECNFTNLIK